MVSRPFADQDPAVAGLREPVLASVDLDGHDRLPAHRDLSDLVASEVVGLDRGRVDPLLGGLIKLLAQHLATIADPDEDDATLGVAHSDHSVLKRFAARAALELDCAGLPAVVPGELVGRVRVTHGRLRHTRSLCQTCGWLKMSTTSLA